MIGVESHDNTVGGIAAGAGNTIGNNDGDGITVLNGIGQTFEGNEVFDNAGLGVDLNNDGVTANDVGDADVGPNGLQNFPVLTAATPGTPGTVTGSLDSAAGTYRIEFFANTTCDPSGNGQGETFLGFVDADANTPFQFDTDLVLDQIVTATATDANGNTSEFSACLPVAGQQFELLVSRDGTGTGVVTSDPAGVDCGPTCAVTVEDGTEVTLTATPDSGSMFAGWAGAGCSGTDTCVVTVDAATTVTATFEPIPVYDLDVIVSGTGTGAVSSTPAGIDCGPTCLWGFEDGTAVTLTATAEAGSVFNGWTRSGCTGTSTCVVTMDQARSVSATFSLTDRRDVIAFVGETAGVGSELYLFDVAAGSSQVVAGTAGATGPAWSGDGRRIAYWGVAGVVCVGSVVGVDRDGVRSGHVADSGHAAVGDVVA